MGSDSENTVVHEHRSYGILCVHRGENGFEFLLVKHVNGDHWAFAKGTPEAGETPVETAVRELAEETGVTDVVVRDDVTFQEEYSYVTADGKNMHKVNTFYLGIVENKDQIRVTIPDEIEEAVWLGYEEAKERLTHDEAKEVIEEVLKYFQSL
jgi:8-oxo-dGTP pyrophosphatase MutT (NUDIX family)